MPAKIVDPTSIADVALAKTSTLSTTQYMAMICSIVLFSLGSQVFYLIPFYMLYPAMICETAEES